MLYLLIYFFLISVSFLSGSRHDDFSGNLEYQARKTFAFLCQKAVVHKTKTVKKVTNDELVCKQPWGALLEEQLIKKKQTTMASLLNIVKLEFA